MKRIIPLLLFTFGIVGLHSSAYAFNCPNGGGITDCTSQTLTGDQVCADFFQVSTQVQVYCVADEPGGEGACTWNTNPIDVNNISNGYQAYYCAANSAYDPSTPGSSPCIQANASSYPSFCAYGYANADNGGSTCGGDAAISLNCSNGDNTVLSVIVNGAFAQCSSDNCLATYYGTTDDATQTNKQSIAKDKKKT